MQKSARWNSKLAACEHTNFDAIVKVIRLTATDDGPVTGYTAEITIKCVECDEYFEFIGLPMGSLPSEPACNVDGTEARMPIRPFSAPGDFGRNLPGFYLRVSDD